MSAAVAVAVDRQNPLAGTRQLLRLALRRDRLMIPLWMVAVVGTVAATVSAFVGLYPNAADRLIFAASIENNPTLRALTGMIYDGSTIGGLTTWRVSTIVSALLGVMSIFVVTRHTRQEEETGRLELLGSTAVARRSPLAAALIAALVANAVAAVLTAAVMIASKEDVAGSIALGSALGLGGLVYGCVAAVTAQLTESSRAANSIASAVLGIGYILRAIGDSVPEDGPTWLSWLSPIGWAEEVRSFAGNRWWVLGVMTAAAALLAGAASVLNQRRDFGASLFATRPGRATAAAGLRSVWALSARLHRGALISWLVGFIAFGAVYGSISKGIAQLLESSPQMAQIIQRVGGAGPLTDAFFVAVLSLFGLVASAYAVSSVLRLRSEETSGRLEVVLSTPASRTSTFGSHVLFALLGPALAVLLAGLSAGIAADLSLDDGVNHLGGLLLGAVVHVPAIWVLTGLTAALVGLVPRWSVGGWVALAAFLLLGQLGPALQLPQWLLDVSPFTHVPRLPGGTVEALPLVMLSVVAVALLVAGLVGFRRRDIG